MKIKVNSNWSAEREYVLNQIFLEFLGIEIEIEKYENAPQNHYTIILNNSEILINDSFFADPNNSLSYLRIDNIPTSIKWERLNYSENKLPIIYGDSDIDTQVVNGRIIIKCGLDIFASIYFMLTRWEEYVIPDRDKHGRFEGVNSTAYINNFLEIPVVNYYLDVLWNMLKKCDQSILKKQRKYKLHLTHDVDNIKKYTNPYRFIKSFIGQVIKGNLLNAIFMLPQYIKVMLGYGIDPYYTFEYIISLSNRYNLRSIFFFLCQLDNEYDSRYNVTSNEVKTLINLIESNKCDIGIHPSYKSSECDELLKKELTRYRKIFNKSKIISRQHYLKLSIPKTFVNLSQNLVSVDYSLGYADKVGFRCGVCYPYRLFDFIDRKQLDIYEYPLLVMDNTIFDYNSYNFIEAKEKIYKICKQVRAFQGDFVFLWHNTRFFNLGESGFKFYESVVSQIC